MEGESSTIGNGDLLMSCDAESEDESLNDSEYESGDDADNEVDNDDEDEEIKNNTTENENSVVKKTKTNGGSSKKRKRKKKDITQRRDIRKIFDESKLDKETLNAQQEEKERLRRLELQKSLATDAHSSHASSNSVPAAPSCKSSLDTDVQSSPVVVDFRKKSKSKQSAVIVIDSDDDDQLDLDVEVISSGPDDDGDVHESSGSDTSDIDENNVGLHSDDKFNVPNPDGSVLVNTDHPMYEDDIFLAPQVAKCVKPHQIGGIRFLYDNLVETLARYKVSAGFGCILAHSMGLGKTLQVIAFTDIFLRHTEAKKVLIVVPINTIQNWMAEFDMWIPPKPEVIDKDESNESTEQESGSIRYRNFNVYILGDSNKTTISRAKVIGLWNKTGGVLLMGYELYRILAMSTPCMASNKCAPPKKKKSANSNTNSQEPEIIDLEEEEKNMDFLIGIQRALCKPGPDLVICDEGHRIKNNQANISQALKKIRTRRRVVLTGYPLQNNLIEYWCMIDFVRPNFLGTRQEFSNMFERPILNGQCSDSTPSDVRLMRYRAHVLHSLLEGFVQRRSQSVLTKCLPMKEEHIIPMKLSDVQAKLYDAYIKHLLNSAGHLNPIKGFHTCTKIWNHPDAFYSLLDSKRGATRNESPLTLMENEMDDTNSSSCSLARQDSNTASMQQAEEPTSALAANVAWAKDIMKDYKPCVAENGGKIVILLEIIKESLNVGEKVLVFSQSLSTLSIIEDFLSNQDIPYFPGRSANNGINKWARNKSYYRLDGSTPSQERDRMINAFNEPDNTEVLLFMLSTRAGCLGVNLIGASRVVVFDVSWNPCHDVQAVCRVYRYGQSKHTHIYRLVSTNTMEKKIYDRQISKQGVANRVVDELNPEANFTKQEIMSLICEKEADTPSEDVASEASNFTDPVLKSICAKYADWLSKVPFKHESLLVDRKELKLTKMEKKEAKKGYEREKNMAQQGSRYSVNPQPDTSRMTSRPVVNTIPQVPPPQLAPVPSQHRIPRLPPYLLNLIASQTNNIRLASLNHNMVPGAVHINQLLPNVSDTLAANVIANQFQINRALSAAANPVSNGSACRLPGSVFDGRPVMGVNHNTTALPTQQNRNKQVVTIDLDDLPSPPPALAPSPPQATASTPVQVIASSFLPPTAADPRTVSERSDVSTVTKVTEHDNVPSPLPTMVTNGNASMNDMASTETNNDVDVCSGVTMETQQTDNVNNELEARMAEPTAMVTGNDTITSSVPRPTVPLAVLQNLLNEQGGLVSRPPPPEESPYSPTGASQI